MASKMSGETRDRAVRMLNEHRPYREIAEQCGIALGTIAKIASQEGIEAPGAEQTAAAAEATKVKWAERRGSLVDALGEVSAELLEKARDAPARDAQAFMTAVAIGVDKAQLLSGGVTSRHEQLDAQRRRERVEAMQTDLEQRLRLVKDDVKDGTGG